MCKYVYMIIYISVHDSLTQGYIRCSDTPCKNNATCSNVINGYECHCPSGFTDFNCSTGMSIFH